jgi:diguanylate cyclase (GGDEF)-like protein
MNATVDRLLSWERGLLQADSLDLWLERAGTTPDGAEARLLLADPTHELQPLVQGCREANEGAGLAVHFAQSLAGVAPQVLAMRGAWRGEYHAADHALLFPERAGLRNVVLLPLQRSGQVVGLYTAATADAAAAFDGLGAPYLDHAADVLVNSLDRHLERARALRGGLLDPLTGWHSSRYLQSRLREEIARAEREQCSVACLIIDVDRLQAVNDELGYGAGDRALQELAARIESQVRASDAAARIGSDAFAIVLPATEAARAAPLARRILEAVRSGAVDLGSGQLRDLRVSIGVAGCRPQAGQDRKNLSDQLVADATAALHRAKRAGGDCCEILAD